MVTSKRTGDGHTLVVVFGAAVRRDGTASPTLARRVGYAAAVAEADPHADLFLSGGVGRFPPSESAVMANVLSGIVSKDRLILDETSGDTLETVRAAAAHASVHGYSVIRTCTDAYHQPRVKMLFRNDGVQGFVRQTGVARINATLVEDVAAGGCGNPLRLRRRIIRDWPR